MAPARMMSSGRASIVVAAALLCAIPSAAGAAAGSDAAAGLSRAGIHARLVVSPSRVPAGDPVGVKVTGLHPGDLATIHVQSVARDDSGRVQRLHGQATYMADSSGSFDLAASAPVAGCYEGVDARGLFWSQRALATDPAGRGAVAALHLEDTSSVVGHEWLTLEVAGAVRDRKLVTSVPADSGLVREAVRSDGLVGVFYHLKGARHRPVVVALSGSEGGLDVADWIGPKLASRGFVVFGLAYFSPPGSAMDGVPTALVRIPVELL